MRRPNPHQLDFTLGSNFKMRSPLRNPFRAIEAAQRKTGEERKPSDKSLGI